MHTTRLRYVLPFAEITADMLPEVGGKNASLGEMVRELSGRGVRVPNGFALTAEAYRAHLQAAGLEDGIRRDLAQLDPRNVVQLAETAKGIRTRVLEAPLPAAVAADLRAAYEALSEQEGVSDIEVAVRSSATAEDLPAASFAGQQETFLRIQGFAALDSAVRRCMASLFTDRAIVYRFENRIPHAGVAVSVGVQRMVRSDLGASGVVFTLDTETGFRDVVLVTGAFGLGETIVQGRVDPDEFLVHKTTLRAGHRPILKRELGTKALKAVYAEGGGTGIREVPTAAEEARRFVLTDDEVLELARAALVIEDHYSRRNGHPTPMDIEWARDGQTGGLFVVQARPETVHSQKRSAVIETFKLKGKGRVLLTGKSVGQKIGSGPVRVVRSPRDLAAFSPGDVLVAEFTDPDWEPILARAAAVVTDRGGRTCHAAIISRELGLPCVVGTERGTATLANGQLVTVDCAGGETARVLEGSVPFEREEIDPATLPVPRVPLMLNVASPDAAFHLAGLPSAGVGLMRVEFLVSNWIGIHPMALVHPERIADAGERREIEHRTARSSTPSEFFVDRMASGIALIAAAFHPRPVIVRFSDFKTNEYKKLLGGTAFEPDEENPMIGFRGASRYYDERYREGFALECRAIRRVREEMGLTNVKLMIPFCRTLKEGRAVLDEMAKHGLVRGQRDLEVWVMCEIPNNVVLAAEFSALFDGFSIGSNDLTQLTLGVDRDSDLLAHIFDERDPGVMRSIARVVEVAHASGRKVGICGQAPSDYPEFAQWLADIGIDSISLNPDSLAATARRLA